MFQIDLQTFMSFFNRKPTPNLNDNSSDIFKMSDELSFKFKPKHSLVKI